MDCSLPGSSVHGILQARLLEWVAILFSRDLSDPGIELEPPALQADPLPSECMRAKSLQLCSTLCDPMDYSLPGSCP